MRHCYARKLCIELCMILRYLFDRGFVFQLWIGFGLVPSVTILRKFVDILVK